MVTPKRLETSQRIVSGNSSENPLSDWQPHPSEKAGCAVRSEMDFPLIKY